MELKSPLRSSQKPTQCPFVYGSTALVDLGRFSNFLIYTQSVGLLEQRISLSQGH
jgi:hypothetical protein